MPGGVTTDVKSYSMLINGEWVASKSAKTFPVYDPSTEEVIARVPEADADDVDRAVAAAKTAFEEGPWLSLIHIFHRYSAVGKRPCHSFLAFRSHRRAREHLV